MNYLFSIYNKQFYKDDIIYLNETKSYFLNVLWGKISNVENEDQYNYLLEMKKNNFIKYLKLNFFLSLLSDELKISIKHFLLTIQDQFKLEVILNDKEEPLIFKVYVNSSEMNNVGEINRLGIEGERCLISLLHYSYNYVFLQQLESINFKNEKIYSHYKNEIKNLTYENFECIESIRNKQCLNKNLTFDCNILLNHQKNLKINIQNLEFDTKSKINVLKRIGGLILYEKLSDLRKCCVFSTTLDKFKPNCIVCTKDTMQLWKNAIEERNITCLFIETFDDFQNLTFTHIYKEQSLLCVLDSIFQNDFDKIYEQVIDTTLQIQNLIEKNIYVSKKDTEFQHITDLTQNLAKKIFFAQGQKFPLSTVPIQWVKFNTVFYDEGHCLVEPLMSDWNWIIKSLDLYNMGDENFILHPTLINSLQKSFFFDSCDEISSDVTNVHLYTFIHEVSILMPISQSVKSKLLPMQMFMQMDESEKEFINCIEDLFNYIQRQDLKISNSKKFRVKDLLFYNPYSKFPYNFYNVLERRNPMNAQQCIQNIKNQINEEFEEKYKGLSLYNIFLDWKFDKSSEPSSMFESVLQNVDQEQPHCYICFENPPEKFGVCGHGYCNDCHSVLVKQKDCYLVCPCPICRINLTKYDWIHYKQNAEEVQQCYPSKYRKMFDELKNSTKRRILIIVPSYTSQYFIQYLQDQFASIDPTKIIYDSFDFYNDDEWISVREEKDLIHCRDLLDMEIVYYISPELRYLKYTYMFLLHNTIQKPMLLLMLVISNHVQEENNLIKLLEIF